MWEMSNRTARSAVSPSALVLTCQREKPASGALHSHSELGKAGAIRGYYGGTECPWKYAERNAGGIVANCNSPRGRRVNIDGDFQRGDFTRMPEAKLNQIRPNVSLTIFAVPFKLLKAWREILDAGKPSVDDILMPEIEVTIFADELYLPIRKSFRPLARVRRKCRCHLIRRKLR